MSSYIMSGPLHMVLAAAMYSEIFTYTKGANLGSSDEEMK